MLMEALEAKRELRRTALCRRRSLTPEDREIYSKAIWQKLKSQPVFLDAQYVFAYASMADEVQTDMILQGMLSEGKRVFLPYIAGERCMEAVELTAMSDLVVGAYGIRAVAAASGNPGVLRAFDLVLVPGVAFSSSGARLGMGGGYYDSFLPHASKAFRIALAYQCQIFDDVPVEQHDCKMDMVITENRIWSCT